MKSAREALASHLRQHPRDIDGLYLLGICEQGDGNTDAAQDLYNRILRVKADHFGAHYNLALLLSNTDRDDEALPHHDAAVRLQPNQLWAYVNRGNARARLGRHELAIEDYRQALAINPHSPEANTNMGNSLREAGELENSLGAHERAIQFRPDYADAWINKAATLIALMRPEEALASLETALRLAPHSAQAWSTRGAALRTMRKPAEALASYDEAIRIRRDFAEAWLNRGTTLSDMYRHPEALESYDYVLKLAPKCAQAWFYRGMTLMNMKSYQEALQSYEAALEFNPHLERLRGAYLQAKTTICDWSNLEEQVSALVQDIDAGTSAGTPLGVMNLVADPRLLLKNSAAFTAKLHPPQSILGPCDHHPSGPKIRLGYFSADFRTHPVGLLLVELFELHDRSRFELLAISFGANVNDPQRERIARACDQFIEVQNKTDKEIAQLSRDLGIDIAIDLGGHTEGSRTGVFAMRAAPIQVNYLGFPGTMGAGYMDYLLADPTVCPPDYQCYYTEKIAYLPHCFIPHDSTRKTASHVFTRKELSLPDTGFVYCCLNNSQKFNPEIFDSWMRILGRVDGSVLMLYVDNAMARDNLSKEARARGVSPERLVFVGRLEQSLYLARYRAVDLFLDTFPYNAGTTAIDALWSGVPVLTRMGQAFVSRMAASLLQSLDLSELVTTSAAAYESLAIELAHNPERFSAIKARLAERKTSAPVFDTKRMTHDVERLYTAMYQRHLNGLAPEHLLP